MGAARRNGVRERREALGLSQVALAAGAGLTRQSIGSIEAGRSTPAVDVALRLAAVLDARVEELFGPAPSEDVLSTEPGTAAGPGRLALAHIAGRWVSHRLDGPAIRISADALGVRARRGRLEAAPLRSPAEARDNVVLMGCAAALGLLADRLDAKIGPGRFLWLARSSTEALESLARGQTHVAGVHLVDPRTGEANVADVRRLAGRGPVALVTLARWEAGLVTAPGNPRKLRRVADLGGRGARLAVRLAVRETGAGARRLLDRELRAAGLPRTLARSAAVHASGHLEVAQAVALGAADTGIATRDAAIAFGLDFVPLAEERYDLAMPRAALGDPRVQRLLDIMASAALRRELASLGYDVRSTGDRLHDVEVA